jgi:hypothetical protein
VSIALWARVTENGNFCNPEQNRFENMNEAKK